uniref:Nuclear receptor n=1 Tax=Strongyloides venezuelensis TaxID=75913 RepID=A0A0K0FML8_STRVS
MDSNQNLQISEYCLVCNVPTNSIHFGVNACKPCSSFFRRTAVAGKTYKCRKATKNCVVTKDKNRMCRYCRYEKCKQIGMALKNPSTINETSLYDHNYINSPQQDFKEKKDLTRQTTVIKSTFEIQNCKIISNFNETIDKIKSIFKFQIIKNISSEELPLTNLQLVTKAINNLRNALICVKKEDMKLLNVFNFASFLEYFKNYLVHYSKFLMELPNFSKYDYEVKMNYLRNSNRIIHIFLKLYISLEIFGYNNKSSNIIVDKYNFTNIENEPLMDPSLPEDFAQNITKLFCHIEQYEINTLYNPMKKMMLDRYEFSYLVLQIIWSNCNIPNLPKECYVENERMLKIVNNELHNYYICYKNLDNYAYRIVEMMKLYTSLKDYETIHESTCTIGRTFNIFDCNIFDTELAKTDY